MQIDSVNNYSIQNKQKNPQFKSAYPVVHWVAETNGSYAPVLTKDFAKSLNTKIVRILNTTGKEIEEKLQDLQAQIKSRGKSSVKIEKEISELNLMKRVKSFIARCDGDYAQKSQVRGFYDGSAGMHNGKYDAIAYMITGDDAIYFEQRFGKPLGQSRAYGEQSLEFERAKSEYHNQGLRFVKSHSDKYCLRGGEPAELHVKLETMRNKAGKVKGYNIVDMRFFPKNGPENPFMLTEWAKR